MIKLKEHCSNEYPIESIKTISIGNKNTIGEHYKCLFEGNNHNQPFVDEDDFAESTAQLFPESPNGEIFGCLEENGQLSSQTPKFYFEYVNCLVRERVDAAEQYCFYRNKNAILYFNCLEDQMSETQYPDEFKDQSLEYAFRAPKSAVEACKSSRHTQSFVTCLRQYSQDRSKAAQLECDIDFSDYDLKSIVDEEQQKIVGNGYKCVLGKLNIEEDFPIIYPSMKLFYKKTIQNLSNCLRRNSYDDNWKFYFNFAKCVEI